MIEGNVSGSDILKESRKWKEFEVYNTKVENNYLIDLIFYRKILSKSLKITEMRVNMKRNHANP